MPHAIEALRSCKYLYLREIGEPFDNSLRLVILEAAPGGPVDEVTVTSEPLPEVRALLENSTVIEHRPGLRVFEIVWSSYIAYSVENESFALPEPNDSVGEGRLLVEYSKSRYLAYVTSSTFASTDYPGPFKHWAVHCLNHIVDIVSTDAPRITVVHGA